MATPIPVNRTRFRLDEILRATGGTPFALAPGLAIAGVTTDSRGGPAAGSDGPGLLFVALRGETYDGHAYAAAVRERGATVLVAAGSGVEGPRLEVPDPLVALGELASAHVARELATRPVPCLAIGGAAGKTTTKTLAHAAVEALFGPSLVTAGNLNNLIGVPMTLLTLDSRHRAMVIECATSSTGEIPRLGRIVRPDVALVLNADIEHSAGLGGLSEIADEEAALFAAARRAAVTWSEDAELLARLERIGREGGSRSTPSGSAPERIRPPPRTCASSRASSTTTTARASLSRSRPGWPPAGGERLEITTPLLGPSAASNLAAATAGAAALRGRPLTPEELAAVAAALGTVPAVPGRLTPRTLRVPAGARRHLQRQPALDARRARRRARARRPARGAPGPRPRRHARARRALRGHAPRHARGGAPRPARAARPRRPRDHPGGARRRAAGPGRRRRELRTRSPPCSPRSSPPATCCWSRARGECAWSGSSTRWPPPRRPSR